MTQGHTAPAGFKPGYLTPWPRVLCCMRHEAEDSDVPFGVAVRGTVISGLTPSLSLLVQFFQSEGSSLYGQKSSPPGSPHRSFPKGLQAKVTSIFSHLSYTLQTVPPPLTGTSQLFCSQGMLTSCPPDGTMTFQSFSFSTSVMNLHEVYCQFTKKVGFHVIFLIYPHSWHSFCFQKRGRDLYFLLPMPFWPTP